MRKAGCRYIFMGIESGSERILQMINKKLTKKQIEQSIQLVKKSGLKIIGSTVVGFPTETEEEVRETISFVMELPLDAISFFLYTPYPNTPLCEFARRHGKISSDWDNYSAHPSTPAYVPETLTEDFLKGIQSKVYWRFFLRPSYVFWHLGDLFNIRLWCKIALVLISKVARRLRKYALLLT